MSIVEVHGIHRYADWQTLLEQAITAGNGGYAPRYTHVSVPHFQSSDSDTELDMGWAVEEGVFHGVDIDYLGDLEPWVGSAADNVKWPPLAAWRAAADPPGSRAGLLPQAGVHQYGEEYLTICSTYFAEVMDRINRLKGANLPAGCSVGIYAETNMIIDSVPPVGDPADRSAWVAATWIPDPYPYDTDFDGILAQSDWLWLEQHQLNADTMSYGGWLNAKVQYIQHYKTAGWNKPVWTAVETAMQGGSTAGQPHSKSAMLKRLRALKDGGADKIILVEWFTPTSIMEGSPTVTISGGLATFSIDQGMNVGHGIGPGVRIHYNGIISYVLNRVADNQFNVVQFYGQAKGVDPPTSPANVTGATVTNIDYISSHDYQLYNNTNDVYDYTGVFEATTTFLSEQVTGLVGGFDFAETDSTTVVRNIKESVDLMSGAGAFDEGVASTGTYGDVPVGFIAYETNITDPAKQYRTLSGGILNIINEYTSGNPFFGLQSTEAAVVSGKRYRVRGRYRLNSATGSAYLGFWKGANWQLRQINADVGAGWVDFDEWFQADGSANFFLMSYVGGATVGWKHNVDIDDYELLEHEYATIVGGETNATLSDGTKVTLNGTDDYLSGSAQWEMGTSDWSVGAVISTTGTSLAGVVGMHESASTAGRWGLYINSTTGKAIAIFHGSSALSVTGTRTINDGREHHLFATYDRDGLFKLYVDGWLEGEVDISAQSAVDLDTPDLTFAIGMYNVAGPAPGNYYTGDIRAVRVYSRVFTRDEVLVEATSALDSESIKVGLVAHYRLDDNVGTTRVIDCSEYAYDATLFGGDKTMDLSVVGVKKCAISFDGVGLDYIGLPDNTKLNNLQENNFALSAWFKPTDAPPGTTPAYNSNYGILMKPGYNIGLMYTKTQYFQMEIVLSDNSSEIVQSATTYPAGVWYHVLASVNRDLGEINLYVDGVLSNTTTFTPGAAMREYGAAQWRIGCAEPGAIDYGYSAKGLIDDVRLYDRMLTASEALDIMLVDSERRGRIHFNSGFIN